MYCAIERPSTEETSTPGPEIWACRKCLLRRDLPGKIPLRNRWWAPSDASAWTTLGCATRDRCVEHCKAILPTTHLALGQDAPEPRAVEPQGRVVAIPQVGG